MKKKLILITALMTMMGMIPSFAQQYAPAIAKKLSISTQMFLKERNQSQQSQRAPLANKGALMTDKYAQSLVAKADTIQGRAFISAFIRLDNSDNTAALEALGVQIQCRFQKGLVTALIPADKIEQVAALAQVKRVNVSTRMRPLTDKAREASNVDDALLNSPDALRMGITNKYDGSGVVLGVIDTGIDFQHVAFKDKNGKNRIKRAYVYEGGGWWGGSGGTAKEYTEITSTAPTTDNESEDHGTHTSSTAGGSSVIIDGNNVTVTDDHAAATYGGMAPGADLYLAGISGLSSTYLANAFQKICNYADKEKKPVVVSNSWGSQAGPHDGTGDFADIMEQYFGDNHPGHICLFAASNDAGKAKPADGGGYHISGHASSTNPLGSILRSAASSRDGGYTYSGIMANAWARTPGSKLACKIYVINTQTGAVLTSKTVTSQTSVDLSPYYTGDLTVYFDNVSSNKSQIMLYGGGTWSYGPTSQSLSGQYSIAAEFYPTSGECDIDVWGGSYGYFSNLNNLTTTGHTWVNGSDNSTVSDEATNQNVIAIGAYSTKAKVTDHRGVSHSLPYTEGDIAYFSSYQEAGEGGTGEILPHISAPGATVVSAVNHYDTSGSYSYLNGNSDQYGYYRVNTNKTSPYGSMEGTSMATPVAAGIVALWLQASLNDNAAYKGLTTSQVKQIMQETAITDAFTTTGANATHFGHGKIDALAGIQKILGVSGGPVLAAYPSKVDFEDVVVNQSQSVKIFVKGNQLSKPVTVSNSNPAFTCTPVTLTAEQVMAGDSVTVTFTPSKEGAFCDTLTLISDTLKAKVSLQGNGKIEIVAPVMLSADSASISLTQFRADWIHEAQAGDVASYTLYVNKKPNAVEVLHEDFSKTKNESDTPISNFNDFTDVPGWSGFKVFPGGNSVVQIGSSDNMGYLMTPRLDLSKSGGKVTVKFNAKSYAGDNSMVYVSCGNYRKEVQLANNYANYVIVLNCKEADGQTVKFACAARKNRMLIDKVYVYTDIPENGNQAAAEEGDSTTRVITGITDKSYTVKDLSAGGSFLYCVKAIYNNGSESALSNQEEVTLFAQGTGLTGDVNMDGVVNVSDVTTLIDKVLGFEPSPFDGNAADLDKNGIYNVTDVTALINLIIGQ